MTKKIKKIDEFLDDDSRFDFNLTNDEITDDEIKELNLKFSLQSKENLKNYPERTKPNFTIEEYREIMLDLQRIDNFEYTEEERAELDDDCMEMYGEPFFKKEDNTNE
jgi:hypothetical protein